MVQIFVLIFSIFYFTRDGHKLKKYIKTFILKEKHRMLSSIAKEVKNVLKSILWSFLTGFIIRVVDTIGFFIFGYFYALFLGILAGIVSINTSYWTISQHIQFYLYMTS